MPLWTCRLRAHHQLQHLHCLGYVGFRGVGNSLVVVLDLRPTENPFVVFGLWLQDGYLHQRPVLSPSPILIPPSGQEMQLHCLHSVHRQSPMLTVSIRCHCMNSPDYECSELNAKCIDLSAQMLYKQSTSSIEVLIFGTTTSSSGKEARLTRGLTYQTYHLQERFSRP